MVPTVSQPLPNPLYRTLTNYLASPTTAAPLQSRSNADGGLLPLLDSSSTHTVRGLADPLGPRVFASLSAATLRCRDCSPRHRPCGQPCGTLHPQWWATLVTSPVHDMVATVYVSSRVSRWIRTWSIWTPRNLASLSPSLLQGDAGHVVRIPSETGHFGWSRLSDNSWLTSESLEETYLFLSCHHCAPL